MSFDPELAERYVAYKLLRDQKNLETKFIFFYCFCVAGSALSFNRNLPMKTFYLIASPSSYKTYRCWDDCWPEYAQAINPDDGDIIGFLETEEQARKYVNGKPGLRFYEVELLEV